MEAQNVRLDIIWRMAAWGGAEGMLLGALYPLLAVILIQLLKVLFGNDAGSANEPMLVIWVGVASVVGLVVGGVTGLLLGGFMGVVLALLTYWVLNPSTDIRRYLRIIEITCIGVGGLAALLLVLISGLPQYGASGWGAEWSWAVWGLTPTLIATAAIWWAGHSIALRVSTTLGTNSRRR